MNNKRNVTMGKMKHECKVVYACNPDVQRKPDPNVLIFTLL